jgi:hypothetical protein
MKDGDDVPPYKKLLQNHSVPPRDMGLVYDPSSMMSLNDLAQFLLKSPAAPKIQVVSEQKVSSG